jgi:2-dehydro-3-deoxygluconokinase
MDVVTLGETMVLFVPTETGPLKYIYQFNKHIGGAESNVAIGLLQNQGMRKPSFLIQ